MAKIDDPSNVLGTFNRVNCFDKNQKDRIKNILLLNGFCEINHEILIENYDLDKGEIISFFSSIVDIANLVLTWEINDEITASLYNRGPINELIGEIVHDLNQDLDKIKNVGLLNGCLIAVSNMREKTFHGLYTDALKGSLFLDFIVSTYSAFEYWMCKIYDDLFDVEEILNSRKKKIVKRFLGNSININECQKKELADQIVKEYCSHIPSRIKIDKVILEARKKQKKDPDLIEITNRDLELVTFYGCLRNSIHNLGVHSKTIDISFYDVKIEKGKASYFSDHSDNVRLCNDLCKLYCKILNNLDLEFNSVIKSK